MELTDGKILLIDKPSGITSYDCIRVLEKQARAEGAKKPKLGHAGTLDPMASGLMLIGVGSATKKLSDLLKLDKIYEAEILLGVRTDTGDVEGKALENWHVPEMSDAVFKKEVAGMVGEWELPVPAYSAIKQNGESLYKKARRGENVEAPVRTMKVVGAEFIGAERDGERYRIRVRFNVESGTYVRSLAEELGRRLSVPATLSALRRTRIGEYSVEDAEKLDG